MAQKKKVNPNRVPYTGDFDYQEYLKEQISKQNIHGCLLVLSALSEMPDATGKQLFDTWFRAEHYDAETENGEDMRGQAAKLFDFHLPYAKAVPKAFHTEGDVKRCKFQLERNCLYGSICVFLVSAYHAGVLSERDGKIAYLNVQLTEEEILRGRRTYEDLGKDLKEQFGLLVEKGEKGIDVRLLEPMVPTENPTL